jgi:disulfide oxidoreductase YuzD
MYSTFTKRIKRIFSRSAKNISKKKSSRGSSKSSQSRGESSQSRGESSQSRGESSQSRGESSSFTKNDCSTLINNKIQNINTFVEPDTLKFIKKQIKNDAKTHLYDYDTFKPKGSIINEFNLVIGFAYMYYKLKKQILFMYNQRSKLFIKQYVSNKYDEINFYIRYITNVQKFDKKQHESQYLKNYENEFVLYNLIIKFMDKVFKCIPKTSVDIITYRAYVSHAPLPISNLQPLVQYTSTTLSYQFAKRWISNNNSPSKKIVKIIIPQNSKVIPLFDYCHWKLALEKKCDEKTEFEILLNRFGYLQYINTEIIHGDQIEVYKYIQTFVLEGKY